MAEDRCTIARDFSKQDLHQSDIFCDGICRSNSVQSSNELPSFSSSEIMIPDFTVFYRDRKSIGRDGKSEGLVYRDEVIRLEGNELTRVIFEGDPEFDEEDFIIIGEFKNTFSRENLEACHEPLTLDRNGELAFTPMGGSRDQGAAVWGNLMDAKFQYRLMISEGRNDANAPSDNPRVTGRIHYSFLDPEFQYGYLGTYLGTKDVFTLGASYDYQKDVAYKNFAMRDDPQDYKACTVDAFYEHPTDKGVITASAAIFDYDTGDVANGDRMDPNWNYLRGDREGYYLKAGYLLPNKVGPGRLQLFARHDSIDYGQQTGITEYYDKDINAVGANYYVDGQKIKWTGQISDEKFDVQNPQNARLRDNTTYTLGFQFIF